MDDRPIVVVANFGRRLSEAQRLEIGLQTGAKDVIIISKSVRFNLSEALAAQIKDVMQDIAQDERVRRYEKPMLVINPPSFAPAAALMGRLYHQRKFCWLGKTVVVE